VAASGRQDFRGHSYSRNVISSISSNGKVEPIAPSTVRAQLDTFIERISAVEGQPVRKGQLLLELNVKDASASSPMRVPSCSAPKTIFVPRKLAAAATKPPGRKAS